MKISNTRKKMSDKNKGLFITAFVSLSILFFFFGSILLRPGEYYFASSGDGMQTYFHALYHTKYDTTLLRQQSVNYPYGESVFFTGCMPALTNTIIILKPLIDLSDQTIGIMNFLILISIPVSALFIFLILQQWGIDWLFGAMAATGIAFFSPQIDRLGGHLALTFQFAIPAYIYFLSLFYKAPSYKKSLLIGIYVFLISTQHLYFFGFAGLIAGIFFMVLFIRNKDFSEKRARLFVHFFLQIILPYLIIQVLLFLSNSAQDRTTFPWGFLVFRANTSSVFFPSRQWYEGFARTFITPIHYEWEGRAYIGLIGIIATLALFFMFIKNLFRNRKIMITGNIFLDILLLVSVLSLLYSFGYPFLNFEELLKYTGPIKQMRGIGRFTWIFFYVMNMAGFYLLYQWTKNTSTFLKTSIRIVAIALLFSEAYPTLALVKPIVSNKMPELDDRNNKLPQNAWMRSLNSSDFQAILPLPYFHIGSENITIGSHGDLSNYSYIVSLKTGLPLYAVSASRTSLSETYKNIGLVTNNSSVPELPPLTTKAFLVICKKEQLNEEELYLYNKSTLLFKTGHFEILKLYPQALKSIYEEKKASILNELRAEILNSKKPSQYYTLSFDSSINSTSFQGKGSLQFTAEEHKVIYKGRLPIPDTSAKFLFSFWCHNFKRDLYPRTYIEFELSDSTGNIYHHETTNLLWHYKQFDRNWALIEIPFAVKNATDSLKVSLYNKDLFPSKTMLVDNLMIKPYYLNVYHSDSMYISKNNRFYIK